MLQKQLVSFESLKTINNYYSVALEEEEEEDFIY